MDITADVEFMSRTSKRSTEVHDLGIMYELRRDDVNRNTVNVTHPFSTASLQAEWRSYSSTHIGVTEKIHEQIELEGTL